jgi:hypothetical protein
MNIWSINEKVWHHVLVFGLQLNEIGYLKIIYLDHYYDDYERIDNNFIFLFKFNYCYISPFQFGIYDKKKIDKFFKLETTISCFMY